MKRSISILGSTGSIGSSVFQIINKKKNLFTINLLWANKNYKLICDQIKKYKPKYFVITDQKIFKKIRIKFKNHKVKIVNNFNDIKKKKNSDITVSAIPGISGLLPTISMIKLSKKLLIANKEAIICGWKIIKRDCTKYKTKIIPIDSEHFSIFKLLEHHNLDVIEKIYITASGGPFLKYKDKLIKDVKPEQALKHPKWKMGKKISIDSATLMNKILEYIEAQKLFNIPKEKLGILIHPESLVHAIVKLKNGLTKFIYHETSMVIPIANAIFGSELNINNLFKNDFTDIPMHNLTFSKPNNKIFPILRLKNRSNEYPSTSIIINASNEILVDQFLRKKIPFRAISEIIMIILNSANYKKYAIKKPININQIINIDNWAREKTKEIIRLKYETNFI